MTDGLPESSERSVLVQDAVSRVLATTLDLADTAEELLETIGQGMGWDLAALWLVDQDADLVRCRALWHVPELAASAFVATSRQLALAPGHGLPGQVWATGKPIWLADLGASGNFPRLPVAASAGLATGLAFPVLVGTEPIGVIECFTRRRESPDVSTLAAVATLGQQIGQFVGRARAEQAVREREARASAIVAAALDAIVTIDHRGTIIEWNPAAEQLFGMSHDDAIGQALADLIIPPALRPAHYAGLERYLRTGEARVVGTRIETTAQDVFGQTFPVELAIARVSAAGPPVFTSYIRDLTERRRHEEQTRFLANASDLLYHSLDPTRTLAQLANLVVPFLADWCIVYLASEDGAVQRVAMAATRDDADALIERIQAHTAINPEADDGVPAVLRSGRSIIIPNATTDLLVTDVDDREALRAIIEPLGIRSWMCVPLTARERTFGAISCIATHPRRPYDNGDLALADDLAHRAALAIDNARLYTVAQQAEDEARRHARQSQALADAARAVAQAPLDSERVLSVIARHAASLVSGLCIIRLLSEDGDWLEPAAVHHADPAVTAAWESLLSGQRQRVTEGVLGQVVQHGRSLLIPTLDEETIATRIKPDLQTHVRTGGIRSVLVVPLSGRQQILGTLGLFRTVDEAPFSEADRDVLEDLAHRAALALENGRLYQAVQQALRQREEFLSIASHELRTPLTSMKAAGQLLARRMRPGMEIDDILQKLVQQLVAETTRLETLVTDLLDAARAQQGRLELRLERFELVELTRRVIERFTHAAERLHAHRLVLDATGPIEGEWDPLRLDQVLTNLVSNALKYSPNGGDVRVTLDQQAGNVTIAVSDEGIGIPAEDRDRLFEPFARSEQYAGQFPGVGLGLYITARIVEQHGGTIAVESTPGRGSTFRVTLPRNTQ